MFYILHDRPLASLRSVLVEGKDAERWTQYTDGLIEVPDVPSGSRVEAVFDGHENVIYYG